MALDDGKPACVAVAGADRDGDAVTFTVVTPPSSGRAFLVPGGCVLATGGANGPVGAEITFAGQAITAPAVVFYPGAALASPATAAKAGLKRGC